MSKHEPLRILAFKGLIHRSHDYCNIVEAGIVASTNLQPYPIADGDFAAMIEAYSTSLPTFGSLHHESRDLLERSSPPWHLQSCSVGTCSELYRRTLFGTIGAGGYW